MAARKKTRPTRRERLLDAARTLFFARGYALTTIEDVSKKAGFSKRVVYLEFPSKSALFATLAEEGITLLRDRLVPILGQRLDLADELKAIASAYLDFYLKERGYYRLLYATPGEALEHAPAAHKARLRELEATCVGVVASSIDRARAAGLVREEVDSWRYAMVVWGAQNGVLLIEELGRLDLARASVEDLYWQSYDAVLRGALAMR